MKVLLVDAFFPSVYGKWRLVEIHSFIEKYKMEFNNCCDELVANCDANGILKDHTYISNVVQLKK